MTDPNEQIAVGATEDGTVVFYDPATQPTIRQVLLKQPPTGGGKSVPPIVLIDELAMLPKAEIGDLTRQLMNQARKGTRP